MAFNLIAHEEQLDIQDPLRHLMRQPEEDPDPRLSSESLSVLPQQSHSIHKETLELSFANGLDAFQVPIMITLSIDASPGCGGVAWPAGQVLSSYLVKKGPGYVTGRNILELGSGTGLVGIVAGKLGGSVWVTDQVPLLSVMRRNVLSNGLESTVVVSELNWGSPVPPDIPSPDLILAADCVYFEPAFSLLVQTLADLASETTEVLFCYKKRRKADKRFFTILKKKFTWVEVSDDPDRPIYNRDAVTLMRLSKIKTDYHVGDQSRNRDKHMED